MAFFALLPPTAIKANAMLHGVMRKLNSTACKTAGSVAAGRRSEKSSTNAGIYLQVSGIVSLVWVRIGSKPTPSPIHKRRPIRALSLLIPSHFPYPYCLLLASTQTSKNPILVPIEKYDALTKMAPFQFFNFPLFWSHNKL